MDLDFKWGNELPTCFIASETDIGAIFRQMRGRKFNSALLMGVASRCPCGKPQVILCKPLLNGIPFPNSFWLSCPILVKKAGQFEAGGGVKELEKYINDNSSKADWEAYSRLHAKIRVLLADKSELDYLRRYNLSLYNSFRDDNIGIGGTKINGKIQVKCLHLQIASFLSLGFHPGQGWLQNKIKNL